MTFGEVLLLVIVGLIVVAAIAAKKERDKVALMSPDDREVFKKNKALRQADRYASMTYGNKNVHILCPHCQTKGQVRTKQVEQKVGISGGKATGAVLTG